MPYYYGYGTDGWLMIALIAVMLISYAAQGAVQRRFNQYAKVPAQKGMPAYKVAEELLRQENIYAQVTPVQGSLTDHYNPKTNMVGLSQTVYDDSSISAVAVAAHEIGHVMQHEEGYAAIKIRNAVLPVANIGSQAAPWIVILGLFMGSFNLAFAGVALFTAVLAFQLVTLPVEFNASNRAIAMLENGGYLEQEEIPKAKKVLRAAAFTYVVTAIASFVSLLRLMSMARRTRRR